MSDFQKEWMAPALEATHAVEAGPRDDWACVDCAKKSEVLRTEDTGMRYRCSDCTLAPVLCKACLLAAHAYNPFHFAQEWGPEHKFWRRMPVSKLGICLELGHDGHKCFMRPGQARPMTIVHSGGFSTINIGFCHCIDKCTGMRKPESIQLVEHGFWLPSWEEPHTGFTVKLLKEFRILSNQAGVNVHDFHEYLRQKTDPIDGETVAVSD